MSDAFASVRETWSGWTWLGCGAALMLVVPVWILVAGVIIQLTPSLSGWDHAVDPTLDVPTQLSMAQQWVWGLLYAGGMLAVVGAVLVPVLIGAQAMGLLQGRRDRLDRERLDALTRDEAVLDGVDVQIREVSEAYGDLGDGEAGGERIR